MMAYFGRQFILLLEQHQGKVTARALRDIVWKITQIRKNTNRSMSNEG